MFLSYKYIRSLEYDKKTNLGSYEYEITDSEWIAVALAGRVSVAVGDVAPAPVAVINAYEKRELPVAPNLALAFQYIAKQCGYTIDEIVNRSKKYNQKFVKYEQELQKYLMLI